jgi:hypothetical protein
VSTFDPSGPVPYLAEFSVQVADADGGRDAVQIDGTADEVAAAVARFLETCAGGAVLQWQVGAGWSELLLNGDRSLAENLEQAWQELEGIGCPPAILSDDEEALARRIVPALLTAARESSL